MSEQLKQLQTLLVELHEVNQEFAQAARPLDRLPELNEEQRRKLADQLRVREARWESVEQQILQVLEDWPCIENVSQKYDTGGSR